MSITKNKPNLNDTKALNLEFDGVLDNQKSYHHKMEQFREYYDTSAFYPPKQGTIRNHNIHANLLKVFADKNIHYTSPFPQIKVLPEQTDEIARESGNIREKVVLATHQRNLSRLHARNWAFDATVMSAAFAETKFDLKKREILIRRLDPRYCYWQEDTDNDNHIQTFWHVEPVTYRYVKQVFGIEPQEPAVSNEHLHTANLRRLDDQNWTLLITRYDSEHIVQWVGNTLTMQPHQHLFGVLPIDYLMPFRNGSHTLQGDFYLRQLVPLQAEFNETLRRRANIVRKLGNPAVWGRGVASRQFDEIKKALSGDGGFVGLKANGELGLLQIPETKMLDNHLLDLMQQMRHISGFGNASFGESVGANTSGDALGMYFNPTTRAVQDQQSAWTEFWRGINSKILCGYRNYMTYSETKKLHGTMPTSTMTSPNLNAAKNRNRYSSSTQGSFSLEFNKHIIGDNYDTIVIPENPTPKDEIAYKRLVMDSVASGFLSHRTGYEEFGILSPEDELDLLEDEQSNPALNPQGVSQLMGAMSPEDMMQPVAPEGGMGVPSPGGGAELGEDQLPVEDQPQSQVQPERQ